MNFEEAYDRYIKGEATEEESAYVEAEIAKAKKLSQIIDRVDSKKIISSAGGEEIRRARKAYERKSVLRTLAIVLCVVAVAVIVTCSSVFGVAFSSAGKSLKVSESEAKNIAVQFVVDNFETNGGFVSVTEIERRLDMSAGISKAVYRYEAEVQCGLVATVELSIDASTGLATLKGVD